MFYIPRLFIDRKLHPVHHLDSTVLFYRLSASREDMHGIKVMTHDSLEEALRPEMLMHTWKVRPSTSLAPNWNSPDEGGITRTSVKSETFSYWKRSEPRYMWYCGCSTKVTGNCIVEISLTTSTPRENVPKSSTSPLSKVPRTQRNTNCNGGNNRIVYRGLI